MQTNIMRELPANFRLAKGSHKSFEDGACAMELVAFIAGESHSDHPQCASPVLTRYCICLNDRWNDEDRQLLIGVLPKLVGTRGDYKLHARQAVVLVDASIREIVPLALEARGWNDLAARLRELSPVVDRDSARDARKVCLEVKGEAYKRAAAAADAAAAAAAAYAAAADAAAYAAAYAYDAAYAAAYAYDADAGIRAKTVNASLAALERAIAIKS